MTLRKIFTLGIILAMFLVAPAAYGAMALVWDSYTDPTADNLRIETSSAETGASWTQLGSDLPTTSTSVAISNGASDTRVYYRVVSYYWGPGGGGGTGIQSPGGVGFIDCSNPANGAEDDVCTSLGL